MGWRYLTITLGAITFVMFLCRFFLFHLYESPKFLLSRGRQEEAVSVVQAIAHKNGAKTWLTSEVLDEIGGHPDVVPDQTLSTVEIIKRQFSKFSGERVAPLFATKKLGVTSTFLPSLYLPILTQYLSEFFVHTLTRRSCAALVLLGDHWHGISSLQRLLASISGSIRGR